MSFERLDFPTPPPSSDASPQSSQSASTDSSLFRRSLSTRNSSKFREFAGAVTESVIKHFSPKSREAQLPAVATSPTGTIIADDQSSPVSMLMPSLSHVDTTLEEHGSCLFAPHSSPSEMSNSTSSGLLLKDGRSSEISKHRSKKVESTRNLVLDVSAKILSGVHGTLKILDGVLPLGFGGITKLLINILDVVETIKYNQEECLTLVRRCANIVNALYEDIERELNFTAKEKIRVPCERLHWALTKISGVALKLQGYSVFERMLYGRDIISEIDSCHQALDDCLRDFSNAMLFRIYGEICDNRSPRRPLTELPPLEGDLGPPMPFPSIAGRLTPFLSASDIQFMSTEDLCDAIRSLEDEQKRRDRERDIQTLKHQARKATRHKSWPLPGSGAPRSGTNSRPKEEVPFSDILLMHVVGHGPVTRVYKAVLDQELVAVKIYAMVDNTAAGTVITRMKDIITNEIEIWKQLSHPHILGFRSRGAMTGTAEDLRTEFVISPYIKYGSVASFLSQMRWNYNGSLVGSTSLDERMIFIGTAKGMEYLHSEKILHGNLKASNVLIDHQLNCLVSDFKYSKKLGLGEPDDGSVHCGIRWRAPEVLTGKSALRESVDIYAYAVFCTEILNLGEIPWPYWSDDDIRRSVIEENMRPNFPCTKAEALGIMSIITSCWDSFPDLRPRFKRIVKILKRTYDVD